MEFYQVAHDSLRCMTVTIGVYGLGHCAIMDGIRQKLHGFPVYIGLSYANDFYRASLNSLRALCFRAQHQHRNAASRGFLLQAAGISHDHVAGCHQIVHILHIDGIDETDPLFTRKMFENGLPHGRIQVYRIDDLDIRELLHQLLYG